MSKNIYVEEWNVASFDISLHVLLCMEILQDIVMSILIIMLVLKMEPAKKTTSSCEINT